MPLSTSSSKLRSVGLVACFLAPTLLVSGVFTHRVLSSDPYWLWHDTPIWLTEHRGHNLVLDRKMRFVKPLQLSRSDYSTIFIGSSRVYRGFDTTHWEGAYNFGISSMRIYEAAAYIQYTSAQLPDADIIWMLDYFGFDATVPQERGFPEAIAKPFYPFQGTLLSLLSRSAWQDADTAMQGKNPGDGAWHRSGFKQTNPRQARAMQQVLRSAYAKPVRIEADQYHQYSEALQTLNDRRHAGVVLLPPLNEPMWQELERANAQDRYNKWRRAVCREAAAHSITCLDFTENHPHWQVEFGSGSTSAWLDPLHFSPAFGFELTDLLCQQKPDLRLCEATAPNESAES